MSSPPHSTPAPVRPWPWWRRHKIISVLIVVVVVAAVLVSWRPWERCGDGMADANGQCVGLNLDLSPFSEPDSETMHDLRQKVAEQNGEIKGDDFITVVVLNNMTPNPSSDSAALLNVQHGVMGAIVAQQRLNHTPVVGAQTPPVKLLLANYGTGARWQSDAVTEILKHRDEQNIVAVIGLGQSLDNTRKAASTLSRNKIAVISALASADNMNREPGTTKRFIERFYRITPTNIDAALAAVSYLRDRGHQYENVTLVRDDSTTDIYSRTLGEAFKLAYRREFGRDVPSEQIFTSPSEPLEGVTRDAYMQEQFARIHSRMCLESPDLVYFAGRGADLRAFLRALGQGGACGMSKVDVLTSDDASSLLGERLPRMTTTQADVYYTSVATGDMWKDSDQTDNRRNYEAFEEAFTAQGLDDDLRDGYAMSHHDAVLLGVGAARMVPNVRENLKVVADWINNTYDCQHPLPGATGKIAFTPESNGNPVGKALPIMLLKPNGKIEQKDLTWTTGEPFENSCR